MTDPVLMTLREKIAVLTLNRPDKLNALSYETNDRICALLDRIEADDGLRAVVITGAGDRAFSAGADIPQFAASVAEGPDAAMRDFVRRGQAMTRRLETFPKPVVVAVNGLAYGGGCEIVEAVHLAVASSHARFAKPEVAIGMPPTFGGTQRLPRLVGRKRALEHLLTGMPFDAETACRIGLVNHVVEPSQLMEATFAMVDQVLAHSSPALAGILSAVTRGLDQTMEEGLRIEAGEFARFAATPGLASRLSAWTERRGPRP
ncbi:crotonase/enoyl-CoA hydratase family protein [Jiella pacifica]|uniref:Crotonase/enoyl-CoA hydratase family protein n=1 Tax=Jiella pacifica TaxID=2696469 RepID=A0A6N9T0E5_9HYPH|nr:crotonase/enoyl-CoA hydratase family protein [Jiella pacifica]NDW04777.1 crotonase/enoyl-CoA hydratase family protein [Jiella pacifica]